MKLGMDLGFTPKNDNELNEENKENNNNNNNDSQINEENNVCNNLNVNTQNIKDIVSESNQGLERSMSVISVKSIDFKQSNDVNTNTNGNTNTNTKTNDNQTHSTTDNTDSKKTMENDLNQPIYAPYPMDPLPEIEFPEVLFI